VELEVSTGVLFRLPGILLADMFDGRYYLQQKWLQKFGDGRVNGVD
jgi:hypothetical protein